MDACRGAEHPQPQQDPGQAARVAAGPGDKLAGPRRPCPGTRFFVVTTMENKGPS